MSQISTYGYIAWHMILHCPCSAGEPVADADEDVPNCVPDWVSHRLLLPGLPPLLVSIDLSTARPKWRTSFVGPSIVFTCQSYLCKSLSPSPSPIIGQL